MNRKCAGCSFRWRSDVRLLVDRNAFAPSNADASQRQKRRPSHEKKTLLIRMKKTPLIFPTWTPRLSFATAGTTWVGQYQL
jgi:hypothetical protein